MIIDNNTGAVVSLKSLTSEVTRLRAENKRLRIIVDGPGEGGQNVLAYIDLLQKREREANKRIAELEDAVTDWDKMCDRCACCLRPKF